MQSPAAKKIFPGGERLLLLLGFQMPVDDPEVERHIMKNDPKIPMGQDEHRQVVGVDDEVPRTIAHGCQSKPRRPVVLDHLRFAVQAEAAVEDAAHRLSVLQRDDRFVAKVELGDRWSLWS